MKNFVISTPNGIQSNKELNALASQLTKLYKTSKNLKRGFQMGFDGEWEYIVENTKNDVAFVMKHCDDVPNAQIVYIYSTSFKNQVSADEVIGVSNTKLLDFAKEMISVFSKK
jgi:hypothetical protein